MSLWLFRFLPPAALCVAIMGCPAGDPIKPPRLDAALVVDSGPMDNSVLDVALLDRASAPDGAVPDSAQDASGDATRLDAAGRDTAAQDAVSLDADLLDIAALDVTGQDVAFQDVAVQDVAAMDVAVQDVAAADHTWSDAVATDSSAADACGTDGPAGVDSSVAADAAVTTDAITLDAAQDASSADHEDDGDHDGVPNSLDCAPADSARQVLLENGTSCVADDADDDDDGVADAADGCARAATGWTSDSGTDHDADGCRDADEDLDDDDDGIIDLSDQCPAGFADWLSDANTDFDSDGCRDSDEDGDDDNDGTADSADCAPLNAALRVVLDDQATCFDPDASPLDLDLGIAWDEQHGGAGLLGNGVRLQNGNVVVVREDVKLTTPHRLGLGLVATYNSQSQHVGGMGSGWSHSFEARLDSSLMISGVELLLVVDGTGRPHYFVEDTGGGSYHGVFFERTRVVADAGGYSWQRLDGSTWHFDAAGQLEWLDDEVGNRQRMSYSGGRLGSVTDEASGRFLSFVYGGDGWLDEVQGPTTTAVSDGVWARFDHDAAGNLLGVTYADGSGEDYAYADADAHNLTQVASRAGHVIASYTYDSDDRLLSVARPGDDSDASLAYLDASTVTATDSYGVARTYTLAQVGLRWRVGSLSSPARPPYGGELRRWVYDTSGNLVETEDFAGRVDQYGSHDSRGLPGSVIMAAGSGLERSLTLVWHPELVRLLSRREASVLGAGDKVTTWDYDTDGDANSNQSPMRLLKRRVESGTTRDAAGGPLAYEYVTRFMHDAKGQVTSIDGPRPGAGDTLAFSYDPLTGDPESSTFPLVGQVTVDAHDGAGNPTQSTDVNGRSTSFGYDGRQRLIGLTHAGGSQVFSHGVDGQLDGTTDEDGVAYALSYETSTGLLRRITDLDGSYQQLSRDPQGNVIEQVYASVSDAPTYRRRYSYDHPTLPGRLHRAFQPDVAAPLDTYVEYDYDAAGRVASVKDARGNVTTYAYDVWGRLIKKIEPGAVETLYAHDGHGNLASLTNALGQQSSFEMDDMGRVVASSTPETGTTSMVYDEAGNLVERTDAAGVVATYTYDPLNRLASVDYPGTSDDVAYTYDTATDAIGELGGIADESGSIAFGYDNQGRLASKTSSILGEVYTVQHSLSGAGRLSGVTYPSGRTLLYGRDTMQRITSVSTDNGSGSTTLVQSTSYLPFGPASSTTLGGGRASNVQYDELYRVAVANPGAQTERFYSYDLDGNITAIRATNMPWVDQSFEYDALSRLTRSTSAYGSTTYTYDAAGNRLSREVDGVLETYTYVASTRLLEQVSSSSGVVAFAYDANGNTTTRGSKTLLYNQANRLLQVEESAVPLGTYTYNALGQRVTKQVGASTTVFHYDLNGNLIAETLASGTLVREYLYQGTSRLAAYDAGLDMLSHLSSSHLGAPEAATDDTGTLIWQAGSLPFGHFYAHPSSGIELPWRLPGQYEDSETGLYDNYFRDYDPSTGRYLQPDPIGLAGGANLYAYAGGNPVVNTDRHGLAFNVITAAVGGITGFGWSYATALMDGRSAREAAQEGGKGFIFGLAAGFTLGGSVLAKAAIGGLESATGQMMATRDAAGVMSGEVSLGKTVMDGVLSAVTGKMASGLPKDAKAWLLKKLVDVKGRVTLTQFASDVAKKLTAKAYKSGIKGMWNEIADAEELFVDDDVSSMLALDLFNIDPSWLLQYDPGNPTQVSAGDSVMINVQAGFPPFAWSVDSSDVQLSSSTTSTRGNTLTVDSGACGASATVTVTDGRGTQVSGEVDSPGPPLEWDDAHSVTELARNTSGGVAALGGCSPYTWTVSGTGFSLASATTISPQNIIYTNGTACGAATITVTGADGKTTSGHVRCTTGSWVRLPSGSVQWPYEIVADSGNMTTTAIKGKYRMVVTLSDCHYSYAYRSPVEVCDAFLNNALVTARSCCVTTFPFSCIQVIELTPPSVTPVVCEWPTCYKPCTLEGSWWLSQIFGYLNTYTMDEWRCN